MKIFKITAICLIIIITIISIYLTVNKKNQSLQHPLPASLGINVLEGIITKIEGSTIEIAQKSQLGKSKPLRVKTTFSTKISKLPFPSLRNILSTTPPPPIMLNIRDLKVGQSIIVESDQKISSKTTEIIGSKIQLVITPHILTGKIVKITDKNIILQTSSIKVIRDPQDSTTGGLTNPILKDYTVKITSDAQIFRNIFTSGPVPKTSKKITIQDLEKDMMITIYSETDPENTSQLTTNYIETAPDPSSAPFSETSPISPTSVK